MNPSYVSLSRRDFLQTSASALLAASLGLRPSSDAAKIPVGMQLYCVRNELPKDMAGTLAALAGMGFEGVEFADYFGRSARELRQMLDDHGLRCCGTHLYLDDMLGDKLEPTVAFNQTLGNRNLIVRWMPEEMRSSREAFLRTAEQFNTVAEHLHPHGMRVGYHNHDYIFQRFDGEYLWNILADHTHRDVILQLDTGNAAHVDGVEVPALIRRNPGRTVTMHVKPFSKTHPDAFIGEDELDWPQIFSLSESVGGIEWYIVEYEREAHPPLEALKANLDSMRRMGK
jgi:sugar phosphate isomerase/epimerase